MQPAGYLSAFEEWHFRSSQLYSFLHMAATCYNFLLPIAFTRSGVRSLEVGAQWSFRLSISSILYILWRLQTAQSSPLQEVGILVFRQIDSASDVIVAAWKWTIIVFGLESVLAFAIREGWPVFYLVPRFELGLKSSQLSIGFVPCISIRCSIWCPACDYNDC